MASHTVGSTPAARGVRKINEQTVQEGRALIITEENESNYSWEDIPNGSLKVRGDTGVILVKLRGQGSWVPSNVRLDVARDANGNVIYDINDSETGHTISIAKDSIVVRENYTIINNNVDENQFSYEDETGQRHFGQKSEKGYHFELQKGHYAPGRNMLEVIIDDCLYRSAASGGIIEQSETKFIVNENLVNGMELTVKYIELIRYGNPYPRIYLRRGQYNDQGIDMNDEPENAEVGDVWIDFTGDPEDLDGYLGESLSNSDRIPWWRIIGYPTSVDEAKACNLMTDVAVEGHKHSIDDITGLASTLTNAIQKVPSAVLADRATVATNAENSYKLQGCTIGTGRGSVVQVQQDGKIAVSIIPNHSHKISNITMDDGTTSLAQGVVDYVAANTFKRGMIIPFYGNDIPSGWAECNGSNGTPDLRDRFIMGVGSYGLGTMLEESVPNITGAIKQWKELGAEGAFYRTGDWGGANSKDGGSDGTHRIEFNASRVNAAYGRNGGRVLPRTCVLRYIMKL
jgi:hypothetical protein